MNLLLLPCGGGMGLGDRRAEGRRVISLQGRRGGGPGLQAQRGFRVVGEAWVAVAKGTGSHCDRTAWLEPPREVVLLKEANS